MSTPTASNARASAPRRVSGRDHPWPEAVETGASEGFDRAYWLNHCEGYRVDTASGRLGFVEEVVGDDGAEAETLVVRAGRLGRRLLLVHAADVAFIVPRAERIWLRSPVAIAGSERAG